MQGIKQSIHEGFEKFVIRNSNGCWDWSGCCPANPGYGQFRSQMKIIRAHRASWMIHFGPIPTGMFVCHKCDNKRCSNPEHLFLGTCRENNIDMLKKGISPILGKLGEKNPQSKLTDEQVDEIICLGSENIPHEFIAGLYDISQTRVSEIIRNEYLNQLARS